MDDFLFEDDDSQEQGGIDLRRYWLTLIKRWWLWSILTILIAVPWVYFVKMEMPVYEAVATIQFQNYRGDAIQRKSQREETLSSRSFAEDVVSELGLVLKLLPVEGDSILRRGQVFQEFFSTKGLQPGKYALRFASDTTFSILMLDDEESQFEATVHAGSIQLAQMAAVTVNGFGFRLAEDISNLPDEIQFNIKNFRSAVSSFQGKIQSPFNRTGTLLWLKLRHTDPFIAQRMANLLAQKFVEKSRDVSEGGSKVQLDILQDKLARAKAKADEAETKLTSFRRKNRGIENSVSRLSEISGKLLGLEADNEEKIESMQSIRDMLQQAANYNPNSSEKLSAERGSLFRELTRLKVFNGIPLMAVEKGRLEDAEKRYSTLVSRTSEKHPDALKIKTEIITIHENIEKNARNEVTEMSAQVAKNKRKILGLRNDRNSLPGITSIYEALKSDFDQNRTIYQTLNTQFNSQEIATSVKSEDISIMDPAIVPREPINGNKKMKAILGVIAGFFMGIGVTLAIEFLDKSMKTVKDVKRYLNVNVLGSIPEMDFSDIYDLNDNEKANMIDNQLVTHDYSPTPIGEAYRSLRTNILFSKNVGKVQTLVLTSMAPGDGKSFTSANLAITMAQHKSSTLLIDTDLRRGVQHNTFGVTKEPGFSNYLTSSIPIPEIIHETHIPNLSVISCGSLIPNPSELLGSHQMRRFLDDVRRRFDLIIFDTPPLNAATDAVVIGTQVDASIIVIRAGKTHREVAKQKMELYHHVPAKVMGIILNGTSVNLAHEGYSYYHY